MANLQLKNVNKIYDNKVQAVFDFNLEIEDRNLSSLSDLPAVASRRRCG